MLRLLQTHARREDGAATVETILWFPFFIFVFGFMVDVAMLFHGQAKVLLVAQEGNREYAIGRIATEADTASYVQTELAAVDISVTATMTEVAGVARTVVSVPASELQVLGFFSAFQGLNLTVTAEHMNESFGS